MLDLLRRLLPWWVRISLKILLSRFNVNYLFWQKIGLFRHGAMDDANYAIKVFSRHIKNAGLNSDLSDMHILELGPGDNLSTGLISFAHGARSTLIDVGHFASFSHESYTELQKRLNFNLGANLNLQFTSEISFLQDTNCLYLTDGLNSLKKLNDQSIDFIFSQAVLEHVRKKDFRNMIRETRRISKPNTLSSHRVDLRDHLGGKLNNLRFSDELWEGELFSSSGFYTNRLRASKILDIFCDEGFEIIKIKRNKWNTPPIKINKINRSIDYKDLDDLRTYSFDILVKPIEKT